MIPTLGASGAIAGLFGAYLYTFPHVNLKIYFGVPALSFISNYRYILDIPIWMFLGVWFALQFFWSFIHYEAGIGGVAWWAHIGGFAAGFIMMMIAEKLKWVQIKRPYLPLSS